MMQNRESIIVCDNLDCGAEFKSSALTILEENIPASGRENVVRLFVKCPECEHRYTILITSQKLRDDVLQYKKLTQVQSQLLQVQAPEKKIKLNLARLNSLKKAIEEERVNLLRKWD